DADMSYTRREFGTLLSGALAAGTVGGTPVLAALGAQAAAAASGSPGPVLDIAGWSYYWYGVEHATLARGTVINGSQMYVEHWIPTAVRRPFAIVLIHGGYGQGTDWISTPDGRRGWASQFLEQGFKVYVVDRPGEGRSPHHPFIHGLNDPQAPTFEGVARRIGALGPNHTQWPGAGNAADPAIAQVVASLGQPMANNPITQGVW